MYDIRNRGVQVMPTEDMTDRLYLLALDTGNRLEIQFVPPTIDNTRTPDIARMKVVGRNTPRYQNTGGEETLSLALDFYADEESRRSVKAKCEWLKTLTMTDAGKKPAQRVSLVFGQMFSKEKWVVSRVNISYSNFAKHRGMFAQQATVQIELLLDTDNNLAWDDTLPQYRFGRSDGTNPIDLGFSEFGDNDDKWLSITNDNNFVSILRRAAQRLRIRF